MQHYVYFESRNTPGSFFILISYFENKVFPDNTVVLLKYRSYSWFYTKLLEGLGIAYRVIRNADDIYSLENTTVYYLFNNASNHLLVANRKLKHIFITHGDSNKAPSVKPIIRIYDEIYVAGQAGIDRFLAQGIFSQYDVDTGRIKKIGNHFIGKTGLQEQGEQVILYAPTWEGVIPKQENYSSLYFVKQVVERIVYIANKTNIKTVLIKLHPNTGVRDKKYLDYLTKIVKELKQNNLTVLLNYAELKIKNKSVTTIFTHKLWCFLQKTYRLKKIATPVSDLSVYSAKIGFCDISAMETQLLNENIMYYLFSAENNQNIKYANLLDIDDNPYSRYYQSAKIVLGEQQKLKDLDKDNFLKLQEYVIESK